MNILEHIRKHRSAYTLCAGLVLSGGIGTSTYAYAAYQERETKKVVQAKHKQNIDKAIERVQKEQAEASAAAKKAAADKAAREQAAAEADEDEAAQQAPAQATANAPAATPAASNCTPSDTYSNPSAITIVVNKKRCFNPLHFVPGDLVTIHGATISAQAAPHFDALMNAASQAGMGMNVSSSYRSYHTQVSTYAHWVRVNGGAAAADRFSARPGYSEHQTGLAVDMAVGGCSLECFTSTPQAQWLRDNAAEFGFIERYKPGYSHITGFSPEAWHYRYVGPAVATDMKARGVHTLEEYWGLEGGEYR